MRITGFPVKRLTLDVIEQHLCLVCSSEKVIALKAIFLVDASSIVRGVGRLPIMVYVFLDLFASLYRSTIGLAVKPAIVMIDAVHFNPGLAEPAHKAVAAVRLAQPRGLCGGFLPERYRRIALS